MYPTTTSYIHLDQLGSTNVVTNAGATAIQTIDYYPYGTKVARLGKYAR